MHWVAWGSALIAVLIAVVIVSSDRRHRKELAEQILERQRLKLAAAKDSVEEYFGNIWMSLRFVSLDPHVVRMSRDSREYLQTIYDENHALHRLLEIYVIEQDFDGMQRPFMAFQRGNEESEVEELHSLDREAAEYAVQMEHIRRFVEDPSLESQMSQPIELCVGEPGLVCSVPIRANGALAGIVAGMVESEHISNVLEGSSLSNILLLSNDLGASFLCHDFPPETFAWFRDRYRPHGVRGFYSAQDDVFQAGEYTALWSRVEIPGDSAWFVAFLYDEATYSHAGGLSGVLTGWGSAVIVLLLGGAVAFLCRLTPALIEARRAADTRAHALSESEKRYRMLVQGMDEGLAVKDESGLCTFVNDRLCEVLGYSREEMIGRELEALLLGDGASCVVFEGCANDKGRGRGRPREVTLIGKDGRKVPSIASPKLIYDHSGRCEGGFAVFTDITHRKRAEVELRESETRLQAILDNTTAVIYVKDAKGHYILINGRFEELFHVTREDTVGKTDYDIFPEHQADAFRANDERVLETWAPLQAEETVSHDDGLHTYISLKFPLYNAAGIPHAVCGISTDITDRVKATEHAQHRLAELAHLDRIGTMGEMAAGLAHELNQPLTAIVTYIQACLERMGAGKAVRQELIEDMEQAAEQAARAGQIVHRMRSFISKRKPQFSNVDINVLAREAASMVMNEVRKEGVEFRLVLADALPPVAAEAIQIEQVIVNLVLNSLEAMRTGDGGTRHLTIRTSVADDDRVQCAVEDTGRGFSLEAAERVFDPFFTTSPEGIGLGLSISRSIIEAHGGRLWAVPNPDRGVAFVFTLPMIPEGTRDES